MVAVLALDFDEVLPERYRGYSIRVCKKLAEELQNEGFHLSVAPVQIVPGFVGFMIQGVNLELHFVAVKLPNSFLQRVLRDEMAGVAAHYN